MITVRVSPIDVLERAVEAAGTRQQLCAALWISETELEDYLARRRPVADAVYLGAMDFLATAG